MGDPARFRRGRQFRSFTGLAPKASETGDTDRKGQAMSKAGSSLLRTTLLRAADTARKQDPQLARIYYLQMVERGKDHLGALCVVAANLAERAWAVMDRGMPYVICDIDNRPVSAEEAKAIIADHWTVPADVQARRRSKKVGKAPKNVLAGRSKPGARGAGERGDLPQRASSASGSALSTTRTPVQLNEPLDIRSSIGNQMTPMGERPLTQRSHRTPKRWILRRYYWDPRAGHLMGRQCQAWPTSPARLACRRRPRRQDRPGRRSLLAPAFFG